MCLTVEAPDLHNIIFFTYFDHYKFGKVIEKCRRSIQVQQIYALFGLLNQNLGQLTKISVSIFKTDIFKTAQSRFINNKILIFPLFSYLERTKMMF